MRFYYEEVELHDDGKLHVRYWTNMAAFGTRAEAVVLDPFEMIAVRFLYPEEYAGAQRDQTMYMPAINLRGLHRKQFRDELQTAADVGLLAAGGAGLIGAGSRLARAVAALDVAMGAADLVIRDFRHEIARSDDGRDFLAAWDIVSTLVAVYGIARVAIEVPRAIQRLRQAWQRLRGTGATRNMGNLGEQVDGMLDGAGEVEDLARQSTRGDGAAGQSGEVNPRHSGTPETGAGTETRQSHAATRDHETGRRTPVGSGPRSREDRLRELAMDPDHAGQISAASRREAEVALALEGRGRLMPEVRRPSPGDGHSGDFVDGAGGDWDVKAPRSRATLIADIQDRARATGRPPPTFPEGRRVPGEFHVKSTMQEIRGELLAGENVIIDVRHLSGDDAAALRAAVEDAGLDQRVIFFP